VSINDRAGESGKPADRDQKAARNLERSYEIVDFQQALLYLPGKVLFKKRIGIEVFQLFSPWWSRARRCFRW
jgi:hypothetical protein